MFQFTHPGRGATSSQWIACDTSLGFNSRTPGGVRLTKRASDSPLRMFQFTHPGRGATMYNISPKDEYKVSIHAPREGCDSCPFA